MVFCRQEKLCIILERHWVHMMSRAAAMCMRVLPMRRRPSHYEILLGNFSARTEEMSVAVELSYVSACKRYLRL